MPCSQTFIFTYFYCKYTHLQTKKLNYLCHINHCCLACAEASGKSKPKVISLEEALQNEFYLHKCSTHSKFGWSKNVLNQVYGGSCWLTAWGLLSNLITQVMCPPISAMKPAEGFYEIYVPIFHIKSSVEQS